MSQVTLGTIANNEADAVFLELTSFVVNAGEGLLVAAILETTDTAKEVLSAVWDQGGGDQLDLGTVPIIARSPGHGKLRAEWWGSPVPIGKTATIRVTLEAQQKFGIIAVAYTNPDTGTQTDGGQGSDGNGTSDNVVIASNPDDRALMVAGFLATASNFSPTDDSVEQDEFEVQGTYDVSLSDADVDSATMGWAHGGSAKEHVTLGLNVRAASAGFVKRSVQASQAVKRASYY